MHQIKAGPLREAVDAIFQAVGAPADIATYEATSLVENNLMGHDSHGVIRVAKYVEWIQTGTIVPGARPEIVKETPTTAIVSGKWAFGQVAAHYGAQVAIHKAKEANIAAVGLVQQNHIGRLGEFTAMMARAGMVGILTTGGWRPPVAGVTPFGGAGRALGTNPYSFAVPTGNHDVVLVDFATSVVAEGKLQVARAKGTPLPQGVVLDKQGNPSTNAEDFYNGGVMLPFGGHKGYALSLLADLLGGLLSGGDLFGSAENQTGTFMICVNVEAFRSLADFAGAVDRRLDEIKAVPPAPGFTEVLIPGEPELRTHAQRSEEGIALPDATWQALVQTGENLGLNVRAISGD
ncbi:MAG: Ldh family oxidoreductase [Chloroflexota bacterium]